MTDEIQFEYYDNFVPLSQNNFNATPILLSDNEAYLRSCLDNSDLKFLSELNYFSSKINTVLLSDESGGLKCVLIKPSRRKRFLIGDRIAQLPGGKYKIESDMNSDIAFEITLGFCLSSYKFQQFYKKRDKFNVLLCVPENVDAEKIKAFSRAEFFVRNLINSPASHLGPISFENVVKSFAKENGASLIIFKDIEFLNEKFPP